MLPYAKFAPLTVNVTPAVPALLYGLMFVIRAELKVKAADLVPTTAFTITLTVCVPTPTRVLKQMMEESVVQTDVVHAVFPTKTVGVTSYSPKFVPSSVTLEKKLVAIFGGSNFVMTGASNVNHCAFVPTTADTETVTRCPLPAPDGNLQSIVEVVVQVAVAQRVLEMVVEGVVLLIAKFVPWTVRYSSFDIARGPLIETGLETTGASNVKRLYTVPTTWDKVSPIFEDAP
jgi:hypothetical protein